MQSTVRGINWMGAGHRCKFARAAAPTTKDFVWGVCTWLYVVVPRMYVVSTRRTRGLELKT